MFPLSGKSARELSDLLDEYGIKHGPVVDSTRNLYEKKLKEAMAKGRGPKQVPDKTYYREEEDEVTYVYRTPVRSDSTGESGSYMRSRPEWNEMKSEHETSYSTYFRPRPEYRGRESADEPYMYDTPSTYRNSYLKSTPVKSDQEAPKASSHFIPLWLQFVFFLVVAVFLYLVFSNMETNESPKAIE